ncbi:MAG: discoidin domain-containing protein, partial [Bacteroidaceae bacterium]|nr:discoidin domain-containing protein [Bacteroidaceae bacterium]
WAHGMTHAVGQTAVSTTPLTAEQAGHTSKYTRNPEGNTVDEAWNLLNKYIVALKGTNGVTKYAYRHLGLDHNDYASTVTIAVPVGTVDLTPYLTGNLTNVTLTSGAVTGNATDLSAVNVTGSAGTYDATLTFDDKTVIKFKLQVNDAKKVALEDLINRTNELIAECGTITPNEPSAITLTESQLSDNWEAQEGSLRNLLDGNSEKTYYVSNWSDTPNTAHYIQIDLGDGNELEQAIITFSARKGGGAPTPTKITISCSTDGTTFNDVQTFTQAADGLPAAASGEKWTSPVLTVNQAARYWRFTVLECTRDGNNKGTNSKGIYHFGIGDLGVLKPNGYTVNVNSAGNQVTEELLLNTYLEVLKAENLLNSTATIEQIEAEIESLQAQYDALYEAYYTVTLTTVSNTDKLLFGINPGQTIGTFSAPYATVIPKGVTVYYAAQDYDGGMVSLTPVEGAEALPAKQGVILIGEQTKTSALFVPATTEKQADLSANKFSHSATGPVEMGNNDFVLAKGNDGIGFYKATGTLKRGKAFFRLPADSDATSLVLKFGGNTTAIDNAVTDILPNNNVTYDLSGRRVTKVTIGGVYIKNGKKFIVK